MALARDKLFMQGKAMRDTELILDRIYDHEVTQAQRIFLIQPVGNGRAVDYTWAQTLDQARRMATHLKSLGFESGARIGLLAKNSAHFVIAELAIWMAGGTTVAIFPTETADNIAYVLRHCEASLLFVGKLDDWSTQQRGIPPNLPCIELPLAPATGFQTWDAIVARTAPLPGRAARAPDDLAMLLYTSGSTGQPKGVMQNFAAITAVAHGIGDDTVARDGGVARDHRMLSYLPLAHCFERAWVECAALYSGRTSIYFSESLATFMDDMKRARPTVFISVPRLWTKFRQAVLARIPEAQLEALLDEPATADATGRRVLATLGLETVVRAGSGSAPLPPELLIWYRRLGLTLSEGYAMTEDFAYSHSSPPEIVAHGCVGRPHVGVQTRIAEDGEILVKSPGTMAGYYKQPQLTAESFTPDGFFRTGDLGRYDESGQLRLTGRKKELFKTSKGKYVAPAPIENLLNSHPMVELSMVSGSGQPAPYAMVVLEENLRASLADAVVRSEVEAELSRLLLEVNAKVASPERLQMIVVAQEPWSIANGCLTPTMKIKRARIEAMVAEVVCAWYAATGRVVWA